MLDIRTFIDDNWSSIEADLKSLVKIDSVRDENSASDDCLFGKGVQRALNHTLEICSRLGFSAHNGGGLYGYADMRDYCASGERLYAIMSHVDVVELGEGWFESGFKLVEREGHLVGRGIIDDKGPAILSIYAMKFWQEYVQSTGITLPINWRLIFGANEESGMRCADEYLARSTNPDFMFTPDSSFSVCYAEKGILHAELESIPFSSMPAIEISGGQSTNAVPSKATARIRLDALTCDEMRLTDPPSKDIRLEVDDGFLTITAQGRSAHASAPEGGVNAIAVLLKFIVENDLASDETQDYFCKLLELLSFTDGSGVGIDSSDEHFGPLTVIGGKISTRATGSEVRYVQTIDIRYPSSTSREVVEDSFAKHFSGIANLVNISDAKPYLTSPDTFEFRALYDAFVEVSGITDCPPYTQGGGTYARKFEKAVSFGPLFPKREGPRWAGGVHCANEAIAIDDLKMALEIYIVAIGKLSGVL